MGRIVLAAVLGAIVYFIWGMLAWMALPVHDGTLGGLPDETSVVELLESQDLATGVYAVPWSDDPEDWSKPESEWKTRHQTGPIFSIYYQREGSDPMSPPVMGKGFVIDLLATLLAAWLLSAAVEGCCRGYLQRVSFVAGLGVFVAIVGHGAYWNWMNFPTGYTIAFMADVIIGWTLAGLVLAAIIRPSAAADPAP